MKRIHDRNLINSFLTQSDILPAFFRVSGDPKKHPNVFFMLGKAGLFVCIKSDKEMRCHAAIPKESRGLQALKDGRDLRRWIFENTDCNLITTRADRTKKHLLYFNAKLLTRTGGDDQYIYYEVRR